MYCSTLNTVETLRGVDVTTEVISVTLFHEQFVALCDIVDKKLGLLSVDKNSIEIRSERYGRVRRAVEKYGLDLPPRGYARAGRKPAHTNEERGVFATAKQGRRLARGKKSR
jgi:hypothetical protein